MYGADIKMREEEQLARRLLDLSRQSFYRGIITYTDFLNLNEQSILHTLPKDSLYTGYVTFGGYGSAERQMAAFLPEDALSLRGRYSQQFLSAPKEIAVRKTAVSEDSNAVFFRQEISVLRISPLHQKYAEELTHRDYLGAMMNLGLERGKMGDILVDGREARLFIVSGLKGFVKEELVKIRRTSVRVSEEEWQDFHYTPKYEEIKGTVPSIRLDALLSLAFSSSRSKLSGLIEAGKVFVNGRLSVSNGTHVKEGDLISVRGMGKFRYVGSISVTRKNRIYVLLHKFI